MAVTVGILGGGQLARMMAIAGAPLGMRFLVLDANEDACAAQVAPLVPARYDDLEALEAVSYTHLTLPTKRIV